MTPHPSHCELEDGYCKRFVRLVDNDGNLLGCPWMDCPHDTRSRPATSTPSHERIGSIRQTIYQEDAYLIERVNAGMGEWEYVIQYCGEYYATAPTENIARDIVERAQWSRPASSAPERDRIFALLSDPETRKEIVERLSQPWSIDTLREIERIRNKHNATIRNQTLKPIWDFIEENGGEVIGYEGEFIGGYKGDFPTCELIKLVWESLRPEVRR